MLVIQKAAYDVIVVGTGFASSFFLSAYLKKVGPEKSVLVLERGHLDSHEWQLNNERAAHGVGESETSSRIDPKTTFINKNPENHESVHDPSFGGGSDCWMASTPRFMPSDFELYSRYGVGVHWPLTYNELEPYYDQAEQIMAVSGPNDGSPYPHPAPYPQPPHRFNNPDKVLKAAYPDQFFHVPTARAGIATANRNRCCATGVCKICPINAKFTVLNEMQDVYRDERVTLILRAAVQNVDVAGGVAKGVTYKEDGVLKTAEADLVILGANALFNPHILLRSGFSHPALGKGLNEQVSVLAIIDLDGIDNYQGSTSITGFGYMQYDGPHRSERAGCLVETSNMAHLITSLRTERGKWRQRMQMTFIFEDLPIEQNYIAISDSNPELPEAVYLGHSPYTQRSIDAVPTILPKVLAPLPVERVSIEPYSKTEQHILGTTVMGNDPQRSIVDRYLVHHQVRNLLVLGSGAFPTCSPAHPTLTISALSLWAADHLLT